MQLLDKSHRRSALTSAFTLTEVLIASTLTVLVMSGVMSTVLMITKSGYRVGQYTDMEAESRKSLEIFGEDVRMAQAVAWTDANTIKLTIPLSLEGTATTINTYSYNPVTKEFWRNAGGKNQLLISGINTLELHGYQLTGEPIYPADSIPTTESGWIIAGSSTKQIELSVSSTRTQTAQIKTDQKIISARFILRNKLTS